MPKRRSEPVEPSTTAVCLLCAEPLHFDGYEPFIAHAKREHPDTVNEEGRLFCRKKGVSFLDGADFYANTFELTLPDGRTLGQYCNSGPRGRHDPMRHG